MAYSAAYLNGTLSYLLQLFAKGEVAGIAQAGDDVGVCIEIGVDCSNPQRCAL